ncbi:hypothetical protein [uncultured Tessaracoccus sp.]|uniref:hypothetical protein n=1 Tax=uncultured Tessaracoccus sp. TaxID=905023 RepID=UPI0025FDAB15|nr:hypothetical protein [uncultured Tessaracoccus sp.]
MTYDELDDEMLAPPGSTVTEAPPSDVIGPWRFSHGFTDSRQAVRIWVDEETRQLQRAKLSPRWRERLAGHSLSEALHEAFFVASIRVGESRNLERPEPEPVESDFDGPFEDLVERYHELLERRDELDARAPENVRWADFVGERTTASDRGGRVTVHLSLAGLTEKVTFDKTWLASAENADIVGRLLEAHRKAYVAYVPPTFVPGEREELADEFRKLSAALESTMSKGIA